MNFNLRLLFIALVFATPAFAQQPQDAGLRLVVIDSETKAPIPQARFMVGTLKGEIVDGKAHVLRLPPAIAKLVIEADGYESFEKEVALGPGQTLQLTVELEPEGEEELAQVVISTTRTGREIEAEPTRVEAIAGEEIDEKSNMRPSNVSMILNESTGIKVQQTSATAYTQSIRIQGLDGRYTQILKDGFPAFGGFSGSLSILDILPLDLQQVEIIKGASSTFYGGGAIAGVVNFISKEPSDKTSTSAILNVTTALGTDASVFTTRRMGGSAYTLLGSVNLQRDYDADGDGFTELPKTRSFNLAPRLFLDLSARTRLVVGNSTVVQRRRGGDVLVVRGRADSSHVYFESNESVRNVSTMMLDHETESGARWSFKQGVAVFSRDLRVPDYGFKGRQLNSFSEVTFARGIGRHAVVAGASLVFDRFREARSTGQTFKRDESRLTAGAFLQDIFEVSSRVSFEGGLRVDHVDGFGTFALPRVSVLFKVNDAVSSRASFGMGYKAPSIFTEEAETRLFRNVRPAGEGLASETSRGGTFDVNFKKKLGEEASVSLNHMFFVTRIEKPLILRSEPDGSLSFVNAAGSVLSRGFETNLRAGVGIVNLFAGYTYTKATADYLPGTRILSLTPRGRLNSSLLLEEEGSFKAGFEAYFTGRQTLSDRTLSPSYWVVGFFGEKTLGRFSVFFNAENVTDTRQSRFGRVVLPPMNDPSFAEIFTHTEGRIFNGGIKFRF